MSIAKRPSKITLPAENKGWNNLLEFLVASFPLIEESIWRERFENGKIHWLSGERLDAEMPFKAGQILCYYREVKQEPKIPFEHRILFQNRHLLVACKPHFLPVTPGGQYVNECLLERIRQSEKLPDLVPLHRLDRETAGLVLFSTNPETRGIYASLFSQKNITKQYLAVARIPQDYKTKELPVNWSIANRLEKSTPAFTMKEVTGEINAQSEIKLAAVKGDLGLFQLSPVTGKTHQLRLHMSKIGMPILNDNFYPELQPKKPLSFKQPLQLLAKSLSFIDPVDNTPMKFNSSRQLLF